MTDHQSAAASNAPLSIRSFVRSDTDDVIALWRDCGLTRPWNDPHRDIERKLGEQPELFLVGLCKDMLIASAMIGFDGHRGWVYYLAVASAHRRRGYGQQLMSRAEALLIERNCPKINLLVRSGNVDVASFYERLGYQRDDAIALGKRLIPDQ